MQDICFYNLHLPDEVRLMHISPECIRLWNDQVLVYDLHIHNLIVRHFSFYTRWYEINLFLNEKGEIESLPGDILIGFICDITSPQFSYGTEFYNVDLAYDIYITPDGSDFKVIDKQDYIDYKTKGYMNTFEAEQAQIALDELTSIIKTRNINDLLEEVYPGHRNELNFDIQPMRKSTLKLSEVPNLALSVRDRQFGKKIP